MTRVKVLAIFKRLHRTRQNVFRDDEVALETCRHEINKYFKNNKSECDPDAIQKMVRLAIEVEEELRQNVVQVRQKCDNVYGNDVNYVLHQILHVRQLCSGSVCCNSDWRRTRNAFEK